MQKKLTVRLSKKNPVKITKLKPKKPKTPRLMDKVLLIDPNKYTKEIISKEQALILLETKQAYQVNRFSIRMRLLPSNIPVLRGYSCSPNISRLDLYIAGNSEVRAAIDSWNFQTRPGFQKLIREVEDINSIKTLF